MKLDIFKYAEQIGEKKGQEKGERQGKKAVVIEMLKKAMDINLIIEITKLNKEEILEIKAELESKKE